MAALSDALETSRNYAAPVQSGVPPVHPLLLIGGTLVVLLVDLIACTMRRAPVAGLVLLAAYTLPVAVTGEAVSWWLFAVIAGLFLTLVFIQHSDHVTSWGRAPEGEKALLLGPHRRDRQHGAGARRDRHRARGRRTGRRAHDEHERLRGQRTRHPRGRGPGPDGRPAPRPAPRRGHPAAVGHHARTEAHLPPLSVLSRFSGSQWTPGDREIPESQAATGALPPLDGVGLDVPRREFKYDVRVGPDFDSSWLPTAAQTTRIAAGNDWRYDLNTRDVIAAREDITTADSTYDYTGVQLDLRRRRG